MPASRPIFHAALTHAVGAGPTITHPSTKASLMIEPKAGSNASADAARMRLEFLSSASSTTGPTRVTIDRSAHRASPLRGLLSMFIDALMGAEADSLCGAGFGEPSDSRNGCRYRDFDTPRRHSRCRHSQAAVRLVFPHW